MQSQEISNSDLLNEIKKLQAQITNMEQRIDNANNILINHIGFIDRVFDTIKRPLFYLMNKVNQLLPQAEHFNQLEHNNKKRIMRDNE